MEGISVGDVVLVRFPFSNLREYKLRPALALADAGTGDFILCQITSQPYHDTRVVPLDRNSLERGRLITASYVRPAKLFTTNTNMVKSRF